MVKVKQKNKQTMFKVKQKNTQTMIKANRKTHRLWLKVNNNRTHNKDATLKNNREKP